MSSDEADKEKEQQRRPIFDEFNKESEEIFGDVPEQETKPNLLDAFAKAASSTDTAPLILPDLCLAVSREFPEMTGRKIAEYVASRLPRFAVGTVLKFVGTKGRGRKAPPDRRLINETFVRPHLKGWLRDALGPSELDDEIISIVEETKALQALLMKSTDRLLQKLRSLGYE